MTALQMELTDCCQLPGVGMSAQINHTSPMILFNPITDGEPMLVHATLLKAVLRAIKYIGTNGPIGLTASKALERYFVQWAAEAFARPSYTTEGLYAVNKVRKEADFPPVVILRDESLAEKLVRYYKGAMQRTSLAKKLKAGRADLPMKHSARVRQEALKGILFHAQSRLPQRTSPERSKNWKNYNYEMPYIMTFVKE